LAGATGLDGARLAAARFARAGRLAVFFNVLPRLLAARVGFAAVRFFRVALPRPFLAAAPAVRRLPGRGAPDFGRLAVCLEVGRFLAFLAMSV
jgi:hypothetical protein